MHTAAATVAVEKLSRAECVRLLASVPVGRLCYTANAMPTIQPVNFVLDGDRLVIRTSSASKLAAATRRSVVAFEVDDVDLASWSGWSVVITGHANVVSDLDELVRLRTLPLASWAAPHSDQFIVVSLDLVTGRWLHSPG
jgi:nitroimidazol reductase NimA-like FMN-containing flavoprotein (pyridoxamine 5'-phosphate oxidase superfamily)